MSSAGAATRPRREGWSFALSLSVVAFVGGIVFTLVGAWASASGTFAFGAVCAAIAALSLRRRSR